MQREVPKDSNRTTAPILTRRFRTSVANAPDLLSLPKTHHRVATTEEHLLDLDSETWSWRKVLEPTGKKKDQPDAGLEPATVRCLDTG
jgi:hypothetical protein